MNKEPRFEQRDAFRAVGLHVRAKPFSDAFAKIWDEFVPRMDEITGRTEQDISYAVEWDMNDKAGDFSYLASLAVNDDAPIPEGMMDVHVPAQEYVVFDFELQGIQDAMNFIYKEWLPKSEYKFGGGPEFEYYGEKFKPDMGLFEMSMYVPVVKK